MPSYAPFAAITTIVAIAFVGLAGASSRAIAAVDADGHPRFTPRLLAVNVLATHGFVGVVLVGAAWYADIPAVVLGVAGASPSMAGVGLLVGVALAGTNVAAQWLLVRAGVGHDETLREMLTPRSWLGWIVLLGVALPVVATVEELLFRAALIGAVGAGFGLPVWALAVVSSAAFGLGHGIQGPGGIAVTAALGFALAVTFIVTGSLLSVVIAHYVVNVLEFLIEPGT